MFGFFFQYVQQFDIILLTISSVVDNTVEGIIGHGGEWYTQQAI